ncbi:MULTISPECIES: hypothetical protein [Nocardia]|uniref:hypothetical protein n=1 Tax=Nocardia TaxID=1817 RepID=UPI0024589221|nr:MULTISPECIES: hypothetical protein [Nocardia]
MMGNYLGFMHDSHGDLQVIGADGFAYSISDYNDMFIDDAVDALLDRFADAAE